MRTTHLGSKRGPEEIGQPLGISIPAFEATSPQIFHPGGNRVGGPRSPRSGPSSGMRATGLPASAPSRARTRLDRHRLRVRPAEAWPNDADHTARLHADPRPSVGGSRLSSTARSTTVRRATDRSPRFLRRGYPETCGDFGHGHRVDILPGRDEALDTGASHPTAARRRTRRCPRSRATTPWRIESGRRPGARAGSPDVRPDSRKARGRGPIAVGLRTRPRLASNGPGSDSVRARSSNGPPSRGSRRRHPTGGARRASPPGPAWCPSPSGTSSRGSSA